LESSHLEGEEGDGRMMIIMIIIEYYRFWGWEEDGSSSECCIMKGTGVNSVEPSHLPMRVSYGCCSPMCL